MLIIKGHLNTELCKLQLITGGFIDDDFIGGAG